MDFNTIINLPIIGQTIAHAIEGGRVWGKSYLEDSRWQNDREQMVNNVIFQSTVWSMGEGFISGIGGIAGIPVDVASTFYSQMKLTSTLFTIHDIDTKSEAAQPLILAAATGISLGELANYLGTQAVSQAIEKALLSIPSRSFTQINQLLGIKLISQAGERTLVNVAKMMPLIGSAVNGTVNGVIMASCGNSVLVFIKTWKDAN